MNRYVSELSLEHSTAAFYPARNLLTVVNISEEILMLFKGDQRTQRAPQPRHAQPFCVKMMSQRQTGVRSGIIVDDLPEKVFFIRDFFRFGSKVNCSR